MEKFLNYDYHIENDKCANSGEYLLYRNEIFSNSYGGSDYKYNTSNAKDSTMIYVGTTPPVAFGITVFFYAGIGHQSVYNLLLANSFFDSFDHYRFYYKIVTKNIFSENNRNPIKKEPGFVEYSFLKTHIPNEKDLFKRSSVFYEELNDNLNFEIKQQLKDYFIGYIQWVEEKYSVLQAKYDPIPASELNKINVVVHNPDQVAEIRFVDLDDEAFIKVVEWVFSFIEELFQAQVNPEANREFIKRIFFPIEKGIVYSYFWEIDNDILEPKVFRTRISKMLLNKEVDNEGLKILLKQCYKYAKTVSDLFDNHFTEKMLFGNHNLVIQFNHIDRMLGYVGTEPPSPNYKHYSNFDLARISAIVANFLEDKLGMSDKEFSIDLTDTFKAEPINREITSYFNKIESFLIFIKEIFELQLNPDSNYRRAADLFIVENRNAQFEFNISQCAQLYDLELFKNTIGEMMIKNPDSKKGLKTILRNHYEVADQIFQLYNHKIDVTTWDRIEHINVKCFGSKVVCEYEAHPAYDEENVEKTNRDFAIFAEQMFTYLKRILFRDKSKKATVSQPEKIIGNDEELKSHPITANTEVSVKSNNEIIDEFLILVKDNETYLDFIHFKLYTYENLEKYNDLVGGSVILPEGYNEIHEIKAASIVLDLDFFIAKTREIKSKGIISESTFYPMMQSLHDKSFKILNSNPQPEYHEMFKLIFIRPERRNKIGIRFNKDDYDYDNITISNDNFILEFCKKLNDFLGKEILNLQPPAPENTVPISLTNIWIGSIVQYESVISILTTVNIQVSEIAFVQKIDGKLTWQFPAKYMRDQYLKGFLYTCLKNNLIKNQTARAFALILSNTFNIECKNDAFKSIISNPPDDKYLKPFISFPAKL